MGGKSEDSSMPLWPIIGRGLQSINQRSFIERQNQQFVLRRWGTVEWLVSLLEQVSFKECLEWGEWAGVSDLYRKLIPHFGAIYREWSLYKSWIASSWHNKTGTRARRTKISLLRSQFEHVCDIPRGLSMVRFIHQDHNLPPRFRRFKSHIFSKRKRNPGIFYEIVFTWINHGYVVTMILSATKIFQKSCRWAWKRKIGTRVGKNKILIFCFLYPELVRNGG